MLSPRLCEARDSWTKQRRRCGSHGEAATRLPSSAFDLSAGNWSYVRDIPADASECFHDGDDHNDQKCQMNERRDDCPKKYQDAADTWNRPEDRMHDR